MNFLSKHVSSISCKDGISVMDSMVLDNFIYLDLYNNLYSPKEECYVEVIHCNIKAHSTIRNMHMPIRKSIGRNLI